MNSSIKPLMIFLVCIAALFYLFTIISAGLFAMGKAHTPPDEWMITTATIIGGILSTNLGAVLGITIAPPHNPVSTQKFHPKVFGLRPSVSGIKADSTGPQKMQILASYFYVGSLLLALVFSIIAKNDSIHFLVDLRNTLAGIVIGGLTVSLGK